MLIKASTELTAQKTQHLGLHSEVTKILYRQIAFRLLYGGNAGRDSKALGSSANGAFEDPFVEPSHVRGSLLSYISFRPLVSVGAWCSVGRKPSKA